MLPGAARIDLTEPFEEIFRFLFIKSTSCVDHFESNHSLCFVKWPRTLWRLYFAPHKDLALRRELDGIADDIEEHLSNAKFVAFDHRRDALIYKIVELEAFLDGQAHAQIIDLLKQ
jgi:hypothetical protein